MKLVIFDIDGTLCNSNKVDRRAFEYSFLELFNINLSADDWQLCTDNTDQQLAEKVIEKHFNRSIKETELNSLKNSVVNYFKKAFLESAGSYFKEIPGSKTFFSDCLLDSKIITSIATGCWENSARFKLSCLFTNSNFLSISTSEKETKRVNIIADCIQKSKLANSEISSIIYIGDGIWDYNAAKELNIGFIGIDVEKTGKFSEITKFSFQNFTDKNAIMNAINSL